jgi:hypothetical protein
MQVRVPEYKSQLALRPYLPHPAWHPPPPAPQRQNPWYRTSDPNASTVNKAKDTRASAAEEEESSADEREDPSARSEDEEEDLMGASVRSLLEPTPDPKMAFGVATSATADTAVARIGFDNDGFMSTSNDGDTCM